MRLEDKCCTLEQSKKLASIGVMFTAPTENIWYSRQNHGYMKLLKFSPTMYLSGIGYFAPDVAELGLMLPWEIGDDWSICCEKSADDGNFIISYDNCDGILGNKLFYKPTEAQARAAALIYLIEEDLLKAEGIKL